MADSRGQGLDWEDAEGQPQLGIGHRVLTTSLVGRADGGDPFGWLTFDLVPPAVVAL